MDNQHLLDTTRLGIFITHRQTGSPIGIPVWFDWDGDVLRLFTAANSNKIKRLQRYPDASLLVTNNVGEPEAWVAFDCKFSISQTGGIELASKLAARYWDLDDPVYAQKLAEWESFPEAFVLLESTSLSIRSGQ